jgi:mannose-6-phosphate isomerase-like protein (cupin superfamily)
MVTTTRFKPTRIFVHLEDGGAALPVEYTPALWRETGSGTRRYDRLVGVFHFENEADLHPTMWEMHPSADEFLFLVSGAVRLIPQEETSERSVELGAGQATIVPRGVWHRLLMRRPGDLLFINSRTGMQHRPVEPGPPQAGVGTSARKVGHSTRGIRPKAIMMDHEGGCRMPSVAGSAPSQASHLLICAIGVTG